jgi:hypothetical protein
MAEYCWVKDKLDNRRRDKGWEIETVSFGLLLLSHLKDKTIETGKSVIQRY